MLHVESSGLRRFLFASAALVAVFVALCAFSAPAMAQTVYDSIPNPVPPSQVSYGFQAYSLRELGDHVQFAPSTSRNLKSISVNMVNWACENGTAATCTTTPGAAFAQPLEIMVYAVDHSTATPQAGALLASQLQTFQIPFRPSADPVCGSGGQWFSSVSGLCHNGYSVPVKFDFAPGIVLPDEVIWSIRYNTQTWGYSPTGVGGPYDSLNVGLSPAATVGTDVDPLGFFVYSQYPDPVEFCAVTLGVFTNATGCQGGYVPAAEIEMMEPACTTACYVNAATGNDLWSGTLTQPKKTIQAAIDAVQAGGTVFVYPGTYSETAAGRLLFNNSGPYQFGLFIDKNGVKLQGVDAAGAEILGSNASAPFILTNATNSFGTSGIFVQGDNVVIDGVRVGPNAPGDNKTIEVIGENFTLADSVIDVPGGGSVYINDWRYVAGSPATCHVNKYTISGNIFKLAASLDISSGAGACTAASDRQILNNAFESDAGQYWPQISFNGTVPAVGWFVDPVGGAVITGNTFQAADQYIRLRGTDTGTFAWESYWNSNTFQKAVITLESVSPFKPRLFAYSDFDSVYRIGSTIQAAIDVAQPGDTVLVKNGTYAENLTIAGKSLSLIGESRAGVIINAVTPSKYGIDANGGAFTFKSFTMNGLATETSGDSYGLKVSGDTSSAVVEDVKVNDFRRTQFDFNGLDSLSVKNIEATNARRGHGVALTDVANAVFENVTTSGNIWGGMNISSKGISFPGAGTNGVRFLGTNTFGELLPIFVELNYSGSAYLPVLDVSVPGYDWSKTNFRAANGEKQWWLFATEAAANAAVIEVGSTGGTVAKMLWPVDFTYPAADIYTDSSTEKFNTAGSFTFDVPVKLSEANAVYSLGIDVNFPPCVALGAVDGAPSGFSVYKETYNAALGTAGIAVASDGSPLAALPASNVAMLHFDATACAHTADLLALVSFGPRLQCGAADGISHVACTSTPGTVTLDFNETPSAMTLTPSTVAEMQPVGTVVGALGVTDSDGNTPPTYSEGATASASCDLTNAGKFNVVNGEVVTDFVFDYETLPNSFLYCVKADDGRGGIVEQNVTIQVTDVNLPPTAVTFSPLDFTLAQALAGATLGNFVVTDAEAPAAPFACVLSGTDAGSFAIDGTDMTKLLVGTSDLTARAYTFSVVCSDNGTPPMSSPSTSFTINVYATASLTFGAETSGHSGVVRKEAGALVIPVLYNANGNVPTSFKFRVNFDAACLAVTSAPAASSSSAGWVQYDNVSPMPVLSVTALASCPDNNGGTNSTPAMRADKALSFEIVEYKKDALVLAIDASSTSTAKVIDNSVRGNCNADAAQGVNAADYVATVLEIFDDTALNSWLDAPMSGFDGSPFGCDSSQNGDIAANDIVCTVHESFNANLCAPGTITPASAAGLSVAAVSAEAGALLNVPVSFDAQGAQIGALVFTLKLDPAKAAFDATDADGDGNPDAIQFNLVDGQSAVALYDAAASKISVAVFSVTQDMKPINGSVASVSLKSLAGGDAGLTIESASASTVDGISVPVKGTLGGQAFLPSFFNYLPMLVK